MDIEGRVVAVTGAASGIGRALARAFHAAGAKSVAVADLNESGAKATAAEIGGFAQACDVADEASVKAFVAAAEAALGPIDIFCSNAGIPPVKVAEPTNEQWQRNWDVHVMAHVYAERAVGPAMAARGSGYLVNTASAAGLLCQVDSAPYSVSKRAAVGFAEWIAIKYAHTGVKVSVLCPLAVDTPMIQDNPNSPGRMSGEVLPPETVAQAVLDAIREERFLILSHRETRKYMEYRHGDIERWFRGMNRMRQKIMEQLGFA